MDDEKLKSKWEENNCSFIYGKDYLYDGISWRQRNFMCNFCKKEYKSAQALGGHMNVHRRDRARLRLSSPSSLDHPNPNPNPNPTSYLLSSPSSSLQCLPYKSFHFPLLSLSTPSSTLSNEEKQEILPFVPRLAQSSLGNMRKNTSIEGSSVANVNGGFNGNAIDQENGIRFLMNRESFRVEMEMDLLKDGKMEMGLDLELRLGRS